MYVWQTFKHVLEVRRIEKNSDFAASIGKESASKGFSSENLKKTRTDFRQNMWHPYFRMDFISSVFF